MRSLILALFVCLFRVIYAYPNGAPCEAVDKLQPGAPHGDPQSDPSPYGIRVYLGNERIRNGVILPFNHYTIEIYGYCNSWIPIKGFLLKAINATTGAIIGRFMKDEQAYWQATHYACRDSHLGAVTHFIAFERDQPVGFKWVLEDGPASEIYKDVKFEATVVRDLKTYWKNVSWPETHEDLCRCADQEEYKHSCHGYFLAGYCQTDHIQDELCQWTCNNCTGDLIPQDEGSLPPFGNNDHGNASEARLIQEAHLNNDGRPNVESSNNSSSTVISTESSSSLSSTSEISTSTSSSSSSPSTTESSTSTSTSFPSTESTTESSTSTSVPSTESTSTSTESSSSTSTTTTPSTTTESTTESSTSTSTSTESTTETSTSSSTTESTSASTSSSSESTTVSSESTNASTSSSESTTASSSSPESSSESTTASSSSPESTTESSSSSESTTASSSTSESTIAQSSSSSESTTVSNSSSESTTLSSTSESTTGSSNSSESTTSSITSESTSTSSSSSISTNPAPLIPLP